MVAFHFQFCWQNVEFLNLSIELIRDIFAFLRQIPVKNIKNWITNGYGTNPGFFGQNNKNQTPRTLQIYFGKMFLLNKDPSFLISKIN